MDRTFRIWMQEDAEERMVAGPGVRRKLARLTDWEPRGCVNEPR